MIFSDRLTRRDLMGTDELVLTPKRAEEFAASLVGKAVTAGGCKVGMVVHAEWDDVGLMTTIEACEHDWRVQPNVLLPTNPPKERLVCAICKETKTREIMRMPFWGPDPEGWPKA